MSRTKTLEEINETLKELKKWQPINCWRPRKRLLIMSEESEQEKVLDWLRRFSNVYLTPLKVVIGCHTEEQWKRIVHLGFTDLTEYQKRQRLEREYRAAWNNNLPLILRPEKELLLPQSTIISPESSEPLRA